MKAQLIPKPRDPGKNPETRILLLTSPLNELLHAKEDQSKHQPTYAAISVCAASSPAGQRKEENAGSVLKELANSRGNRALAASAGCSMLWSSKALWTVQKRG